MATIKLGELLIKANVLQAGQLKSALAEQQKWGGRLGDILVRMEFLTEELLVKALSKQLGIPAVNLDAVQGIAPHVKAKIPVEVAREFDVVPMQLRDDGKTLVVAMAEPQHIEHVDLIRARANCRVIVQVAGRSSISRAISRFYEGEADLSDFEDSFKLMDSQGRTLVKNGHDVSDRASGPRITPTPPQPAAPERPQPARVDSGSQPGVQTASEILKAVEEVQRKEVAALKAMVEILIDKGVFSREEYLAKVKR